MGVLDRVAVESVKERESFSVGEVKNVSKKGVKGTEEATVSAKKYDMDIAGQVEEGRTEIRRAGKNRRPPPTRILREERTCLQ